MAEAGWMAGWIREISPRWMEKQLRNRRNTGFPRSAALAYVGDWFWEWERRSTKKIFHCLHALIVNMLRIDDIYRLSLTCNYCQLSCFYKNWHTLNYQMSLAPFTAVNRKKKGHLWHSRKLLYVAWSDDVAASSRSLKLTAQERRASGIYKLLCRSRRRFLCRDINACSDHGSFGRTERTFGDAVKSVIALYMYVCVYLHMYMQIVRVAGGSYKLWKCQLLTLHREASETKHFY